MKFRLMIFTLLWTITLGIQCIFASNQFFAEESLWQNSSKAIDKIDDLAIQERVNLVGDSSAVSSYAKINQNWKYIKIGSDVKTESPLWKSKMIKASPTHQTSCLLWGYDQEPYIQEAVKSVLNSATHAECLNAARIVRIKINSDILEAAQMGCLITKLRANHEDLGSFNFLTALSFAFQTQCEEDFQGICFMSFVNIPCYLKYKPMGNAANHNVIKLSDGRFIGFDPAFFTQPRSYDEFERRMYDEFMSAVDIDEEKREEYKEFCKVIASKGGFEEFKRLRREYQAKIKPYRFDVSKIERFIKTGEL